MKRRVAPHGSVESPLSLKAGSGYQRGQARTRYLLSALSSQRFLFPVLSLQDATRATVRNREASSLISTNRCGV